MREMVLNHVSLTAPDQRLAAQWLQDTAIGMANLVQNKVASPSLRMNQSPFEISCATGTSLGNTLEVLRKQGAREESLFFLRLSTKVPLAIELQGELEERFHLCEAIGCEAKPLSPLDGEPLVMCAIIDGIAVGFPSDQLWKQKQITITFHELLPNGRIEEVSENVDNLTQSTHADSILARVRTELRQLRSPESLWEVRETAFPSLLFGPEVEGHLTGLDRSLFRTVVRKLGSLDEAANLWQDKGGPVPHWTCNVTPESASVLNNVRLREARRFRSLRGTRELFTWHARFGSSGRIHLRFDANAREVEIGYVGLHLPL